jgi:hypothetical protein
MEAALLHNLEGFIAVAITHQLTLTVLSDAFAVCRLDASAAVFAVTTFDTDYLLVNGEKWGSPDYSEAAFSIFFGSTATYRKTTSCSF